MSRPEYETIDVPVQFTGTVQVKVPKTVPIGRRGPLAEKQAICFILATLANDDAPEADAIDQYAYDHELGGEVAEAEWDGCVLPTDVSGVWKPRAV